MNVPKKIFHRDFGLLKPENVHCICRNFAKHAEELGNTVNETPVFFEKSNAAVFCGSDIEIPDRGEIQHELEIVVLIGEPCSRVSETKALSHVSGITLGLDLTDREFQSELKEKRLPWYLSKSFQNSAWVGTFEVPDWDKWKSDFWLKVNGVEKQRGNLKDMVYSIKKQIAYLSTFHLLAKGDLVYTGTPEGVGSIIKGDVIDIGLGDTLHYTLNIV